ncbi:MAG: acyl-CoA dehydratase activase-related protein [Candidatus Omnitrophica bacterium]|nr:acyl-CoA dehydratase activase-related protein [Candidatus Omnitrophota bacterium]
MKPMKNQRSKKPTMSFPRYGKYTPLLSELFTRLGANVIIPPPITKRTTELGTLYSPSEVCYPFKITLGTLIEASELGAESVVMANSEGWCILRCYNIVQAEIMKAHGYKAAMAPICIRKPIKFVRDAKRLIPGLSVFKLTKEMYRFFKKVKELDKIEGSINKNADIKIGIAGEVYVCNENTVNMDIVKKLQALGVFVDRWLCLSNNVSMLFQDMFGVSNISKYSRLAKKYFPVRIGGHANENLVKLIKYAEEGYDGAIMLKPFACNPETVIEPIVDRISRDYDMPILCLSIDESTLETHFQTRVESFVDMLKMRKALI